MIVFSGLKQKPAIIGQNKEICVKVSKSTDRPLCYFDWCSTQVGLFVL